LEGYVDGVEGEVEPAGDVGAGFGGGDAAEVLGLLVVHRE